MKEGKAGKTRADMNVYPTGDRGSVLAFEVEGAEVGAVVDALDEFDEEPGGGVEVGEGDDFDLGVHVALGDADGGGGDAGVGDLDHAGVVGGGLPGGVGLPGEVEFFGGVSQEFFDDGVGVW